MPQTCLEISDWGQEFKAKDFNNQIKKLDQNFKLSLLVGAVFISASFIMAIILGYSLFAVVTLVLASTLGVGLFGVHIYKTRHNKANFPKISNTNPNMSPNTTPSTALVSKEFRGADLDKDIKKNNLQILSDPLTPIAPPITIESTVSPPKHHSAAKMHEIWDQIQQSPSTRKPNRV